MKKIDKILSEMRKDIPRVVDAKIILRNYADRIEAEVKALEADRDNWRRQALDEDARANATREKSSQVGNAAAMLKALKEIQLICWKAGGAMRYSVACGIIKAKSRVALAEPPRNCDVYIEAQLCEMVTEEIKSEFGTDIPQGIIGIIEIVAKGMIKGLFAEAKGESDD